MISLSRHLLSHRLLASASLLPMQRRFFDLHEYQSKYIMNEYGVNVQKGSLAHNAE